MKIFLLLQGYQEADQPSFSYAFQNAVVNGETVEYRSIPYRGFIRDHGQPAFWDEVVRINREFEPDLVFFQFFQDPYLDPVATENTIRQLKNTSNAPLIFGSQGDPYQTNRMIPWVRFPSAAMMAVVRNADAFFTSSMGTLADYFVRNGGQNIVFLPHAYGPQNFSCEPNAGKGEKDYDAVMVCSIGINPHRPLGSLIEVAKRWADATKLWKRFGKRFAVFGRGWISHPAYQGTLAFKDQVTAFQSSITAVDACAPVNEVYYASDRPFFIAGSGACLVQRYTPRFDRVLHSGREAEYAHDSHEVLECCERLVEMDEAGRRRRVDETIQTIKERHMVSHRVDTILSVYDAIRAHRQGALSAADALRTLRLWHFLPDVDLESEYPFAVANWVA